MDKLELIKQIIEKDLREIESQKDEEFKEYEYQIWSQGYDAGFKKAYSKILEIIKENNQ